MTIEQKSKKKQKKNLIEVFKKYYQDPKTNRFLILNLQKSNTHLEDVGVTKKLQGT